MKFIHTAWAGLTLIYLLASCGVDRSGEYYALIADKTWIYETMQQNYLFYEDIPAESELNFFDKPDEFLRSASSQSDQKNGTYFSHVDSVSVSRAMSEYPTFGFEAATVRTNSGNALRVIYVEPDSPATEAGLKRGDWIIAVDGNEISSNDYEEYVSRPTQAHSFTLGSYNPYDENEDEELYVEFDTIGTVELAAPRYIEQYNILTTNTLVTSDGHRAFYMLYNEFGEDGDELQSAFSGISSSDDIILDLRYNPGGYVSTSQILSTLLAPQSAVGQTFLNMTYNDKINKTETLTFDASLLSGGAPLSYRNLYIITSSNTASASEIVINCLKPYMEGRLFQVGAATFGKNVAQQCFTNEASPYLELWLTTSLLSNSENFSDYYDNGLAPDFEMEEDFGGDLYELGSEDEALLQTVLYHVSNGAFPSATSTGSAVSARSSRAYNSGWKVLSNSIDRKPKLNKFR